MRERKRLIVDVIVLLIPGVITALGYALLASGQIAGVRPAVAAEFLLFVPWQALGLTVCKFGLDAWLFALCTGDPSARLDLTRAIVRRVLPAAIAFAAVAAFRYEPAVVALLLLSVALDALGVIVAAELSGHGKVRRVAFAHLTRYPMFFMLVALLGLAGELTMLQLVALFTATSTLRAAVLLALRGRARGTAWLRGGMSGLALQQSLNFTLFKADQLLFPSVSAWTGRGDAVVFAFAARFPEIVSAAFTSVGASVLPRLNVRDRRWLAAFLRSHAPLMVAWTLTVVAGAFAYSRYWPGAPMLPGGLLAGVAAQAVLMPAANAATYSLLRDETFGALNRALLVGHVAGLAVGLGLLVAGADATLIVWAVVAQLLVFLIAVRGAAGQGA